MRYKGLTGIALGIGINFSSGCFLDKAFYRFGFVEPPRKIREAVELVESTKGQEKPDANLVESNRSLYTRRSMEVSDFETRKHDTHTSGVDDR